MLLTNRVLDKNCSERNCFTKLKSFDLQDEKYRWICIKFSEKSGSPSKQNTYCNFQLYIKTNIDLGSENMFCVKRFCRNFLLSFWRFLEHMLKERLIFVFSSDGVFHFIFLMLGIVDEKYSLLQGNLYLPCSPHSLSFKNLTYTRP